MNQKLVANMPIFSINYLGKNYIFENLWLYGKVVLKSRLLLAFLLLVVLIISIGGYSIYVNYVIKPSMVPGPVVFSYNEDYWRGSYAFGFAVSNGSIRNVVDQFMAVMDHNGNYISYENSSTHSFNYINQLSESEFYYYYRPQRTEGDPDPSVVAEARIWDFRGDGTRTILDGINIQGHHEFLIEDGYFVTMRRVGEGGLDTVVHLDPLTGNETWFWSSEPYFPEKLCELCRDDDWTHGNDVTVSLDGRYYFVNFRNTDNFAKIEIDTQELVWIAGRNGNFSLLEDGVEKESLWYHSHIIKEVEPNVFLMFDNDFHNSTKLDVYPAGENPYVTNFGGQSRLIEITFDESTMTGEVTWSYVPDVVYFSAIFGDVDVLPNGNILGIFGTPDHRWTADLEEIEEPFGAALLEINREGELIREYRFPLGVSIYRVTELSDDPADYVGSWLLEVN